MAYALVFGNCISCGVPISFNPLQVPSLMVNGIREPICRNCFDKWNQIHRVSKGLEPALLSPDAYEPIHEEELP